jgi:CBS domain-containing protein
MKVRDVMTDSVERIPPETMVREAANKMKTLDVGALPVYEGDRLIGMVTDRDIAIRVFDQGSPTDSMTVRDVMSPGITYCFEDEGIKEAAEKMRQAKIRRLIVLNREKRLVGIVSLGDLAVLGNEKIAGNALEGVAESGREQRGRKTSRGRAGQRSRRRATGTA